MYSHLKLTYFNMFAQTDYRHTVMSGDSPLTYPSSATS